MNPLIEQIQVLNAVLQRSLSSGSLGMSPDGKRNYNEIFCYGDTLTYADYYGIYQRGGIARVVISKVARACWRTTPRLHIDNTPVLTEELNALKRLGLFAALERADILNRIGRYSVFLVGVPDGQKLDQPLGTASASGLEACYFQCFAEPGATVLKWIKDPASPRYGLPEEYQLRTTGAALGQSITSTQVHWQRVVCLAEGALENPCIGSSALEPIYNAVLDKEKVRGSAAEAFFRNAQTRYAMKLDESAGGALSDAEKAALKLEVDAFNNGWQSYMRLKNMDVQQLTPSVVSPKDAYDIIIQEIAGATEIPVRVLTGVGGGQLAGSEDRGSWNALIYDRQQSFCSGVLNSVLTILDEAGLINVPEGLEIDWPLAPALNEIERADVNYKKSLAIAQLANARSAPGGEELGLESMLEEVGMPDIELDTLPDLPEDLTPDVIQQPD